MDTFRRFCVPPSEKYMIDSGDYILFYCKPRRTLMGQYDTDLLMTGKDAPAKIPDLARKPLPNLYWPAYREAYNGVDLSRRVTSTHTPSNASSPGSKRGRTKSANNSSAPSRKKARVREPGDPKYIDLISLFHYFHRTKTSEGWSDFGTKSVVSLVTLVYPDPIGEQTLRLSKWPTSSLWHGKTGTKLFAIYYMC